MNNLALIVFILLVLASLAAARARAQDWLVAGAPGTLDSMPIYHGIYAALWCAIPALILAALWFIGAPPILTSVLDHDLLQLHGSLSAGELSIKRLEIVNIANGALALDNGNTAVRGIVNRYRDLRAESAAWLSALFLASAMLGAGYGYRRLNPGLGARRAVERALKLFLFLSAGVSVLTTLGIVFALLFESLRFFQLVSLQEFLFGLKWSPQIAIRADQAGSSGAFGAVPLFAGTFMIAAIAMLIATPVGLMSAVYLSEYAGPRLRATLKPALEILAGIPTVVYGFFATLTVAPLIRDLGTELGLRVSSESALAAGVVMGVMIIPFVSSLSDDVIHAVPQSLRDGALALGATPAETICRTVLPAALPGIAGALLLAVSRAIGETMIVVMAAGLSARLSANPLEALTTVTVQIVTILVGDQEFDSAKTLAAFALGLVLFCITLVLNLWALSIVKHFRERYE